MSKLNTIYEILRAELADLPGEHAHQEMAPYRKLSSLSVKDVAHYKTSAVLGLFYIENEQLMLVLIERQSYKGKHSGQISFPGGKKELSDIDTIYTALRETHEEIGIPQQKINILGKLTDVYIPISEFLVHPYLGYMNEVPEFILSEREVKSVITFPAIELLKDSTRVKTKIKNHQGLWMKDIPGFEIQNKTVWGATALMLNEIRLIMERIKI